jgi:hypothetical protein
LPLKSRALFFLNNFMTLKKIGSIVAVASILLACNNKEEVKKVEKQDYQHKKESLLDNEKKDPKEFITIEGKDKRNIWGQTVFKGTVKNNATVCSYKNIRVKLLYFKEGSQVANHEEQFDETIKPGNEFEFKARYKTPRGTDSVAASIMNATPNTDK